MRENILHFIWQHQYYNVANTILNTGSAVQIMQQGLHNSNAGPDFSQAKIKIEEVEWNGDVEIHVNSSDWYRHKHQHDKAYNRVILHVVWQMDKEVLREDKTPMPTLVLKKLVDKGLLDKVDTLINSIETISCSTQLNTVSDIVIVDNIQRLLVKRLERKAEIVLQELRYAKGDWAEVAYKLFMRQMGMKINGDAFYDLAELIPYRLIRKYHQSLKSIEALLFGGSGFLLANSKDEYALELKKEYAFLAHKHNLNKQLAPQQWKFMRLRPSNFPTLRLAQAASLLAKKTHIFEMFTEFNDAKTLESTLNFITSNYWSTHYRFEKEANGKVPLFGKTSMDLLFLNVVSPLLAAYAIYVDNQNYIDKALRLIEHIKPEKNKITKEWNKVGITAKNGGESQGLIELYNESCNKKACLTCGIGFSILKN